MILSENSQGPESLIGFKRSRHFIVGFASKSRGVFHEIIQELSRDTFINKEFILDFSRFRDSINDSSKICSLYYILQSGFSFIPSEIPLSGLFHCYGQFVFRYFSKMSLKMQFNDWLRQDSSLNVPCNNSFEKLSISRCFYIKLTQRLT